LLVPIEDVGASRKRDTDKTKLFVWLTTNLNLSTGKIPPVGAEEVEKELVRFVLWQGLFVKSAPCKILTDGRYPRYDKPVPSSPIGWAYHPVVDAAHPPALVAGIAGAIDAGRLIVESNALLDALSVVKFEEPELVNLSGMPPWRVALVEARERTLVENAEKLTVCVEPDPA
jgi:hypothetical protein